MKKSLYETLLSFLLGISFAFLIIGSVIAFKTFLDLGLSTAIFSTIIFIFITLFFILMLETMNLYVDGHAETKKQTKLLFEIRELLKKDKRTKDTKENFIVEDD